jgi:hypothetical protein
VVDAEEGIDPCGRGALMRSRRRRHQSAFGLSFGWIAVLSRVVRGQWLSGYRHAPDEFELSSEETVAYRCYDLSCGQTKTVLPSAGPPWCNDDRHWERPMERIVPLVQATEVTTTLDPQKSLEHGTPER